MTAIPVHADHGESHWLRVELLAPRPGERHPRSKRTLWLAAGILALVLGTGAALTGTGSPPGSAAAAAVLPKAVPPTAAIPAVPALVVGDANLIALLPTFERWAKAYRVPVDLLEAVAWHESRWQAGARSAAGAVGIGQLMPSTAAALTARIGKPLNPWRPADNIQMTTRLLAELLTAKHGDERAALAQYTQGSSSIAQHGPTQLTARYVDEIMNQRNQFSPAHPTT